MKITRNLTETGRGPADWFTGDVYIDTVSTEFYSCTNGTWELSTSPTPSQLPNG